MKQQKTSRQAHGDPVTAKLQKATPQSAENNPAIIADASAMYKKLFDMTPEGIMILDEQTGQIVDVNIGLTNILNCTRQDLIGHTFSDILSPEDLSAFQQAICNLRTEKHSCHTRVPFKTKVGKDRRVAFDCDLFEIGNKDYIRCSIQVPKDFPAMDKIIEEYKAAEENLRKSEEKYRNILESIEDGYYEADLAGNFTFFNESICRIWGYTREELVGMNNRNYMDHETAARLYKAHNDVYKTGKPGSPIDYEIIRKDGTKRIVESSVSLLLDNFGNPMGFRGIIRDVTSQKQAQEALSKSEEKYRQAFSSTSDVVFMVDRDLRITSMTPSVEKILGYHPDEMIGHRLNEMDLFTPSSQVRAVENIQQVFGGETITNAVFEFIAKDGSLKYGEITASPIRKNGSILGMIAIARDVTQRKKMEEDIIKSEMRYRTIVENSQEGIFQAAPDTPRTTLNHAFATMLGYDSTEEAEKNIISFSNQVYVNPGEYQKVMDIVLQDGGIKGYETEFYRKDKSRIWVSMGVSAVRDTFGNLLYYHGIVEDITPKKKLEQERQDSINRLRRSLGATINAMSATVEARDPYTAGHQRRVSDLARAIASEMKLSRDQIDGIRMAGMIHDIGKISVPSEILTKPTRLTALEFELIKTHSEAGFNILKDIEFPWPIARIVLEHHERINGTGYPNGLKGEDILLESKIIAVADVVEAISSNRPYRPAFGITPALDEVSKNSGVLYDKDVAEACLRLFQENRYKMPF